MCCVFESLSVSSVFVVVGGGSRERSGNDLKPVSESVPKRFRNRVWDHFVFRNRYRIRSWIGIVSYWFRSRLFGGFY